MSYLRPTAEERYFEHVAWLAWLTGAAMECFDVEQELGDDLPVFFRGGGLGRMAAVLLDYRDLAQLRSGYPGREAFTDYSECEDVP